MRLSLLVLVALAAATPALAGSKTRHHHAHRAHHYALACPTGHGLNRWERCDSICHPYAMRRAYASRRIDSWDTRVRLDEFDIWDRCMTDRLGVDYFARAPLDDVGVVRARY
jgi:hypothetical protein